MQKHLKQFILNAIIKILPTGAYVTGRLYKKNNSNE